jgi:hypothetical protein
MIAYITAIKRPQMNGEELDLRWTTLSAKKNSPSKKTLDEYLLSE